MGKILKDLQRHLMTATSYMILFVVPLAQVMSLKH